MADTTWFIASFLSPLIFHYHLPLSWPRGWSSRWSLDGFWWSYSRMVTRYSDDSQPKMVLKIKNIICLFSLWLLMAFGDKFLQYEYNGYRGDSEGFSWWLIPLNFSWCTVKKKLQNSCIFFYQTFQKRENPSYADKGFFDSLQRRNFLAFEEEKVFLSLQG